MGSVLCDRALRRRQCPCLVPGANSEGSRQIVWPEQPGGAGLANLEPVAVEGRCGLQARLLTPRQVAVVTAQGDIEALGRRNRRGDAVGRVVISGERAEDGRVHEYRRVE